MSLPVFNDEAGATDDAITLLDAFDDGLELKNQIYDRDKEEDVPAELVITVADVRESNKSRSLLKRMEHLQTRRTTLDLLGTAFKNDDSDWDMEHRLDSIEFCGASCL